MGQTLTNGIYLPAEGERNCYEGLAANWTFLDGMIGGYNAHIGNATIHVTSADKQAWNGKADASALTAHTGDTTIHVTAEDKNKWDAVTSKANDNDVVHKSGNETVAGYKVFENICLSNSIKAINLENQTIDLNNCYSSFGFPQSGNISFYFCNTNNGIANISNLPEQNAFFLISQSIRILSGGRIYAKQTCITINNTYVRYCKNNIWLSWINVHDDIEPSSLSLPSDRSARIDISSYFTNTGTGNTNDYSVPANGFIFLNLLNAFAVTCYSIDGTNNVNYAQSYFRPVDGQIYILFPVRKNDVFRTLWTANGGTITVTSAYFIPCRGNV